MLSASGGCLLEKRTRHATGRPAVPDHSGASARQSLTADAIAAELETSKRTIYRDITTLIEQRVPIRGEAGVGYILEKGFDLPLMLAGQDRGLRARRAMGRRPCRSRAGARRAGPDGESRRNRPERLRPFVLEPASRARRWNQGLTASTWCGRGRKSTRARRSR